MSKCFAQSSDAYKRGDHAGAKSFSEKGKAHQKRMEELNAEAAEWIFKGEWVCWWGHLQNAGVPSIVANSRFELSNSKPTQFDRDGIHKIIFLSPFCFPPPMCLAENAFADLNCPYLPIPFISAPISLTRRYEPTTLPTLDSFQYQNPTSTTFYLPTLRHQRDLSNSTPVTQRTTWCVHPSFSFNPPSHSLSDFPSFRSLFQP